MTLYSQILVYYIPISHMDIWTCHYTSIDLEFKKSLRPYVTISLYSYVSSYDHLSLYVAFRSLVALFSCIYVSITMYPNIAMPLSIYSVSYGKDGLYLYVHVSLYKPLCHYVTMSLYTYFIYVWPQFISI